MQWDIALGVEGKGEQRLSLQRRVSKEWYPYLKGWHQGGGEEQAKVALQRGIPT
jgi:hypothetical protein